MLSRPDFAINGELSSQKLEYNIYQAGLVLSAIVFSTAGVLVGLLVTAALYPEVIFAQPLLFVVVTVISSGLLLWLVRRDRVH